MRISATAIFTLATLAAANVTQQATAAPTKAVTANTKTDNLVVPVIEDTPTRIETIASPETIIAQQFSQNPAPVPTAINNNSRVVLKPVDKATLKQKDKNNSSVTLPLISSFPSSPPTNNNLVVTATDVQIVGGNQELQQIIRKVIKTQAGRETSQSHLQRDVAAILDTGLFNSANVNSRSTSAGLNVVYQVQPVIVRWRSPTQASLQLSGAKVLTYQVAQERLQSQIGNIISPTGLEQAVARRQWL